MIIRFEVVVDVEFKNKKDIGLFLNKTSESNIVNGLYQVIDKKTPNRFIYYHDCVKITSIQEEIKILKELFDEFKATYQIKKFCSEFYAESLDDIDYRSDDCRDDIVIAHHLDGIPETNNKTIFDVIGEIK